MKAVFGLASSEEHAQQVVDKLVSAGFHYSSISLLLSKEAHGSVQEFKTDLYDEIHTTLVTEEHTKALEGSALGAVTGGVLGGSLGLLAGIGALSIPGMGPFIAAGPLMGALSGSAVGGSVGLLIGALVGYGIPEYEAKAYEVGLKAGKILLSVHTDNYDQIVIAKDVMKQEGVTDIATSTEKIRR